MALWARLEAWVNRVWRRRGAVAWLLAPLALLHLLWWRFDRWRYRVGFARAVRPGVPVVVIGNLYVGGTGKTPLAIEVVRALRARGWFPGVVSRGYGSRSAAARLVQADGTAAEYGDEPLLIARATGAPVAVGADRVGAARLLLNLRPNVDVIVADDGLQHRRLARDVEIALVHELGVGNGWLLPAGPLREPPRRLVEVDAVVLRGQPTVRIFSPFFRLRTSIAHAYSLRDPTHTVSLSELAREQASRGVKLLAAAGIGQPQRFFAMLREFGLTFDTLELGDHYDFAHNPFAGRAFDCALITEKDAVKCAANRQLAADSRICVVPLQTQIDAGLIDLIEARIKPAPAT
ncbi:MAG TPA: tetraacyldisaccharide 4'-kinase, partial [Burkholderiaceae bacterium]|nr:tetraacyldisaccharide 4'-kinase [Burkholderiaceae bacterium]